MASTSEDALFRDLQKYNCMTREEEIELAKRKDAGDETAIDEFVLRNMRFVRRLVYKYRNKGISMTDLIKEGAFGLETAARKFDHTRGNRFATYAYWWIRSHIQKAIANTGETIRIPIHRRDNRISVNKAVRKLYALGNPNPAIGDIEKATGLSAEKIKVALEPDLKTVSLDSPIGPIGNESNEHSLSECLPDQKNVPADVALHREHTKRIIGEILGGLTEREKTIIEMRFGFNGYEKHSLDEAGKQFGVCRERIRQIQREALRKLRIQLKRILDKEAVKSDNVGALWEL
ncbi:RNA polymerase sigma factor RpoD/SigA [Patescibacteria group bacterium]|nr:RNA polymerase sigma factor RpoD/SigA [Patescibacteria group bacterium]